ncbi:MAG: glycosyltransferase family 87 protein [Myxococcota bacterium]
MLRRIAVGAVVVLAVAIMVQVLDAFAARLVYPFDLEWMEGGMLAHSWRLQRGLPLYGPPSPDFVPFVYPPGYAALVASLGDVFGLDYPLGRLVSGLSTVAAAGAIGVLSWRQTGSWAAGVVGAACFLGLFRASGGFYDLVRPDALAMALLAWSVVLATERARGADVASGLLLCGSFLVKHNFAAFGVPLVAMIGLRSGLPSAIRFTAASAGPALFMTGLLQLRSGGGFLTYVIGVPGSHPMAWNRFWIGMASEVGIVLLPALVGLAMWLFAAAWAQERRRTRVLVATLVLAGVAGLLAVTLPDVRGVPGTWQSLVGAYATFTVMAGSTLAIALGRGLDWRLVGAVGTGALALLVSALMRAHHGGFMNVVMPAHWTISAGLGLGLGWALQRGRTEEASWVGLAVGAAQLGWLLRTVDFSGAKPDPANVEAGEAALAEIAKACPEGRILVPTAAWLPVKLGRPPSVHLIGMWDLDHPAGPWVDENVGMLRQAASEHYWACAVQGSGNSRVALPNHSNWRLDRRHYERSARLSVRTRRLLPRTGYRVRVTEVLSPKADP